MSSPLPATPKKLFIATPCYGGMLTDKYFHSILKLAQEFPRHNIGYVVHTIRNESLVQRARNSLVAMFLKSDCTHLLFIDADIQFEPESVLRMLAMDKGVIGGAYPQKQIPLKFALNLLFDGDPKDRKLVTDNGAVEVQNLATGFMLIRRDVFVTMMEAFPRLKYINNVAGLPPGLDPYFFSFFDTMHDPETNVYQSEDYTFCLRWRQTGGRIWIDPKTVLSHVGTHTFTGNISHLISCNDDGTCRLRRPVLFGKPSDQQEPGNP